MKKILCFLCLILLLVLIALPPLLRSLIKDDTNNTNEEIQVKNTILSCSDNNYILKTSYKNDIISMIVAKKSIVKDDNIENKEDDIEETPKSSFDSQFEFLKEIPLISYKELEDGDVVALDFSIYDFKEYDLSNFIKTKQEQKNYYESLGFTCTIIE